MSKINWIQVTRTGKLPLFLMCAFPYGYKDGRLSKFLKINFRINYYRRILGSTYFERKEWDNYLKLIQSKENKNPGHLLKLGKEFEKRNRNIILFCKKYQNFNFSKWEINHIERIYRKFIELKKQWLIPDYTYYVMDRYLAEVLISEVNKKLKDKQRFNNIIEILTGLDRPTLIREEKSALLKLADLIKKRKLSLKNKKIEKLIKAHIKKFGFLNHYFYYYKPYSIPQIKKRIKEILRKDLRKEVKKIELQKKNKILTQKIIKELKLSPRARLIIKTLKQWGYCLNYLDEAGCLITYYFKNFLSNLALRMGIDYEMLIEMTFEEIKEFFNKGLLQPNIKVNLKERIKNWGLFWLGKNLKVYSGKELEKLEKLQRRQTESQMRQIELIKGIAASSGIVRGKVRILESYRDIAKMKKNEILVTSKTNPKFVPAMEKALAIVTNEGGVTLSRRYHFKGTWYSLCGWYKICYCGFKRRR